MNTDGIEKPNFTELARQTGISRQTLSKKWRNRHQPSNLARKKRKGKYDDFEEEIRTKFLKTGNMSAVYHYFQNSFPETFTSYEGFRYYCQSNGFVCKAKENKVHVRFETDFGEQVQVDWKEDLHAITCDGEAILFNLYVMVLSASRKKFMCIAFQKTTEEFFRCTIETLQRVGGCPKSLLTDNMAAICNHQTGRLLDCVREFLKDMGFDIRRCKIKSPETKGKVESANRFVQWLAPYQGEIKDIQDLYEKVRIIEKQMNQETNDTTGFAPDALYPADRKVLKKLPRQDILKFWMNARDVRVQNTLLVNYERGQYSVPKEYIGKTVTLVPCSETLYVYKDQRVIRVHSLDKQGGMHYDPNDYYAGLSESMENASADLVAEQARRNLEMISKMEWRKNENKNSGGGSGSTEK